jgi:hypothetical protein
LGSYSESQRRYDTFHNEWDCCEDFRPGDLNDEDEDEYFSPVKIDTNQTHDPPIQSDVRLPSPPPIVEQQPVLEAAPNLMSVVRLLHLHYGFIPPLPMPYEISQLGPKNRDVFTKATGISLVDGSIFTTGLGKVMYNFIKDLVAKRQPNQSLWYLQRENHDALAFRHQVNFLCWLLSGIILFDFG